MEWSDKTWTDKTWSDETGFTAPRFITPCFTTPRFITPCFITPLHSIPYFIVCPFYYGVDHHILWLHVLLFPSSTKWCWADRPFIPELRFFFSLLVILFFTFFLPSVTDSKSRHAFDARQKRDDLSPSSPARQTHNSANHKGIRSVDKLLNSCTLLDLQRFLKTRELWSSKVNWSLRFSLLSIILADFLGQRTLLKRVQKVIVCDLWLADFNPFCLFLRFKVRCLWS